MKGWRRRRAVNFLGRESEQGVEPLYFGGKNMLKEAAF